VAAGGFLWRARIEDEIQSAQMSWVLAAFMWLSGLLLVWFAVQTIKHPVVGYPVYIARTWQLILLVLGGGLIIGAIFV
jgi:hypothetical protein